MEEHKQYISSDKIFANKTIKELTSLQDLCDMGVKLAPEQAARKEALEKYLANLKQRVRDNLNYIKLDY